MADNTVTWTDSLALALNQWAEAAAHCSTWTTEHFADSSELRSATAATAADQEFAGAAHTHLESLVRACWATTTHPPAVLLEATRLLATASPGPWELRDQSLMKGSWEIARLEPGISDPHLVAEASPGEPGELGHQARHGDLDLLAAAPRLVAELAPLVREALDAHQPDLTFVDDYDLTDPDEREQAREMVADIGVWEASPELAGEIECTCGQLWPCVPRQLLDHHLS